MLLELEGALIERGLLVVISKTSTARTVYRFVGSLRLQVALRTLVWDWWNVLLQWAGPRAVVGMLNGRCAFRYSEKIASAN